MKHLNYGTFLVLIACSVLFLTPSVFSANRATPTTQSTNTQEKNEQFIISDIIVKGNTHTSTRALLNLLKLCAFKVGEPFSTLLTREAINKIIKELPTISTVKLYVKECANQQVELHVVVTEKNPLKEMIINGNKAISYNDIAKEIKLNDYSSLDLHILKMLSHKIEQLYFSRGYHNTTVDSELQVDAEGVATAIFTIHECKKSLITKISFCGNNCITSKTLRSIIYSKEDWLLSFLDKSGTYQVDRLEADKQMIEHHYQNNGYIHARVTDIKKEINPLTNNFEITFVISEGKPYCIASVKVSGENLIPEDHLLARIPVWPGILYSRKRTVDSMSILESIWGNFGYIFSHVEPEITTNDDTQTVDVQFNTDLGNQIYLNRVNIVGNKKTNDRIIRRQLTLCEGGLLCSNMMDASKQRIESLGYFDVQNGVNWKVTRLDDDLADLELVLKEAQFGNASFQLNFGGSETTITSPLSGLAGEFSISNINLFGEGIRVNARSTISKEEKTFFFNFTQPWLFNRPIFGALDLYHQRYAYDELKFTDPINEKHTGASATTGFVTGFNHAFFADTYFRITAGIESIKYNRRPHARIPGLQGEDLVIARAAYETLLTKMFDPGTFGWLSIQIGQDKKNHPMHPSNGYSWTFRSYTALPSHWSKISFNKTDLDAHYFTPLIGAYDLIFHLHGNIGIIAPFKNRVVPYEQLFHIGGPASVRGFLYGQIGPQFCINGICDSIGATREFFINAELIFPITADLTMKGVLFYDGGAGWKNPYTKDFLCVKRPGEPVEYLKIKNTNLLCNNNINYRHAVGVGLRMLQPVPLRIDWGFKLDRRKGEPAHEIHFNMSYDWD